MQVQDRRRHRRAIALDQRFELQAFARRHHRHAVPADVARQQDDVAHPHARGRHHGVLLDQSDAGGVDVEPVALAPVDHLGVAGHQHHAGRRGRGLHRLHDALQHLHRQALFDDEAGAEELRTRAAHREVVDGAVHGQRADVAAGKEQRPHDVGVGGERHLRGPHPQPRAVVALAERRVLEGRHERSARSADWSAGRRHHAPSARGHAG